MDDDRKHCPEPLTVHGWEKEVWMGFSFSGYVLNAKLLAGVWLQHQQDKVRGFETALPHLYVYLT